MFIPDGSGNIAAILSNSSNLQIPASSFTTDVTINPKLYSNF